MDNSTEKKNKRTNWLPIVPLRGKVAFPHVQTSFDVGREVTLKAIERSTTATDRLLFVCTQKDDAKNEIGAEDIYEVGTVSLVKSVAQLPGGTLRVTTEGLYRARARSICFESGHFYAVSDEIFTIRGDEKLEEAYFRTAKEMIHDIFSVGGSMSKDTYAKLEGVTDMEIYTDILVASLPLQSPEKQGLLETAELTDRLETLNELLNAELEVAKIGARIKATVRQNMERTQKELLLREQLKAIRKELGDNDKEEDVYRRKLDKKDLPDEVRERCQKELNRMGKMQMSSPEYTVITGYLDWVLDLPWREQTTDTELLSDCMKVLNEDHYGLDKIKERITEYLAVLKLTGDMKAPILCLVGPPGVGKTSIARSIARSLGRKFVRMSLGGVKDEAEIRGHRRTYIGAMPGRILYAMKTAGSINPVFLLDEIDKISSDMRGDPASALLEVLDPEQNSTFRDRYLEVPYDLSKVLFLTTANSLDTIPEPLRDRMEIIELSGYTLEEKTEIAARYLVPKQLKANGLTAKNASFTADGLRFTIEGYTREAGVRTLERTVGTLCRKIAVQYADNRSMRKVRVNAKKAEALLGAPRFKSDEARACAEVGAVTGLAWTAVGGTTLTVEAALVHGKGELRLTGKLGDVMKESAFAALTYIHAHASEYGIPDERFENSDIHVHVPEGAIPKDGPSAGVTIATAILSAFTGKPVKKDVAMTGEITLRGKVLPVGGLKEKALAARRIGVLNVVIPAENEKDIEEIPESVRAEIRFVPVKEAGEVFREAFVEPFAPLPERGGGKRGIIPVTDGGNSSAVRCKE